MDDEQQQPNNEEIVAQYRKKLNEFNVIKHRTDTKEMLNEFHTYLTGCRTEFLEEKGKIIQKRFVYGVPKANESGIQTIMQRMNCIINQHTIQGNFPLDSKAHSEAYEQYCHQSEVDLILDLGKGIPEFDIEDTEFQGIVNSAMATIKPVMSRCIDNKERDSYGETSKHVESHSEQPQHKGILGRI